MTDGIDGAAGDRPDTRPRVVLVDDDIWVRGGRADALRSSPDVVLVACLDHGQAIARPSWDDTDVVVLDAYDPSGEFDKFRGVAATRAIRARASGDRPRIVVVSGHASNELLRLRLAEAGADYLYAHTDVMSVERLVAVVVAAPGAPLPRSATGINQAIDWAAANIDEDALATGESQKALPISRRRIITARRRFAAVADDAGADGAGSGAAGGRRPSPDWRAVVRFVNRARGAERRR